MKTPHLFVVHIAAFFISLSHCTHADTFGSGANTFEIEFVTIGDPGNLADSIQFPLSNDSYDIGAVPYEYRIGKYEISEQLIDTVNALGNLDLSHDVRGPNKPATNITWVDAAKFTNWLNESKGFVPAYKFGANGSFQLWQPTDEGYDSSNPYRNRLARFFLPSMHEWHKAAFYDAPGATYFNYATGTNLIPDGIDFYGDSEFEAVFDQGEHDFQPNEVNNVGSPNQYGTFGQAGNVWEWEETDWDLVNNSTSSSRGMRGGAWFSEATNLHAGIRFPVNLLDGENGLGFRVASIFIPEPSTLLIGELASAGFVLRRRPRLANSY